MADVLPFVTQTPTGIKPGVSAVETSEAPVSRVSGAEVAQPAELLGRAFDKVGNALDDAAVPFAKRAAAESLLNQKITRNADGSLNVENPASAPLIFGRAGQAYHEAIATGTAAQWNNELSQTFAELHQQHPTDPAAFKHASDKYIDGVSPNLPPQIQEAIVQDGRRLQTQHFNAITDRVASLDIENNKKSILANIDDQKNTLIALARKDGTDTPEFKQATAKLNNSYDALGTNPLFKTPQDQIDIEKKNTTALLQGEALNAEIDATFKKRDGKAQAQQMLERDILQNPNLREIDRTRLYAQGLARLQFLSGDAKATVDANRVIVGEMEKGLADGRVSAEDPAIGMAIQRARDIGDVEGTQRLTAAAAVQQHLRGLNALPTPIKNEALGIHLGPVERVQGAILGQESGNRDVVPASITGAVGPGQVEPKTFAAYARPGESIDTPADNRAVSNRIVQDYFNRYGGDAQRVAVAYFSGPGNVAPVGSATPWVEDKKDPTGKSVSSYVMDVSRRLGAPSVTGGPGFSAEDVQKNPFLLSAYVRSLSADPDLRVQSAKQTATAIGKALDNGFLPSPQMVAEVNQGAALFPEKLGTVADEMNGRLLGQKIAQLPEDQRDKLIADYKAAMNGPDVHQINIASAALAQVERQTTNMKEHPLTEAANRGWTQLPLPIDPTKPETIAPALAQRATLSARIGNLNGTPNPPLLDKDDMPKLQSALQGQGGAGLLTSIGQTLKPDEMQTLLKEEGFRTAVTGLSRSGDPAKMNAAYSFMDTLQKENPLQFDKQFTDGLKDLRAWQSNLSFYTPEEAAKRMMKANDPANAAARDAVDEVADKALKLLSADKIVAKFSTGWGPFGTGAQTPVAQQAGIAAGALKADYDKNFKDGYAATGDAAAADNFAMEKLNLKYAISPTNGNRVMPYAPERYYPQVGGSHDWMAKQLDEVVAKQFGMDTSLASNVYAADTMQIEGLSETPGERMYGAMRAVVPDEMTERDIAAGRPPSYQVIIRDPNGRWAAMTNPAGTVQRLRFDPTDAYTTRATDAERVRPTIQDLQTPLAGGVTP